MQDQICGRGQMLFGVLALRGPSIRAAVLVESNDERRKVEEEIGHTKRFKESSDFVELIFG